MTTTPPTTAPRRHPHLRHPGEGETTLYLVRHGRTASNVGQILHGSTDVPLDATGLRQAQLVADRLAAGDPADALLASPLTRALTTARIIGARIGREPRVVPELVEMDFGDLEGITVERLAAEHPELASRFDDLEDHEVAWPGGESRRGFHARVMAAFLAILADHPGQRVVVVAHGGVIGSFLAQVEGNSPNDYLAYRLGNTGLTHLHITADHTDIHLLNDLLHLEVLGASDGPDTLEWLDRADHGERRP